MFAGAHQVAIQGVEVQRVFAEGLAQTAAGFHVGLDVAQQFGDRRVAVPFADDVESL